MAQARILIVETGGTISQTKGRDGVLRPSGKSVITPELRRLFPRIELLVESISPHRDSTNILHEQRAEMAEIIARHAADVDGVVIPHGTDTMAPTAAALTFMLSGFGKPILLTGSILPIEAERSDASANLELAIEAATLDFGEVGIAFWDAIYRGPRAIKMNLSEFHAFESPRADPIGISRPNGVELGGGRIPRFEPHLNLFTDFNTDVLPFIPASGSSVEAFSYLVEAPGVHGLVMIGYGAGNIPEMYYDGIARATQLGKPIVIATECQKGTMSIGSYAVGATPLKLGAISGLDMTPATAMQKLMYAIGKVNGMISKGAVSAGSLVSEVKKLMHTNHALEFDPNLPAQG